MTMTDAAKGYCILLKHTDQTKSFKSACLSCTSLEPWEVIVFECHDVRYGCRVRHGGDVRKMDQTS